MCAARRLLNAGKFQLAGWPFRQKSVSVEGRRGKKARFRDPTSLACVLQQTFKSSSNSRKLQWGFATKAKSLRPRNFRHRVFSHSTLGIWEDKDPKLFPVRGVQYSVSSRTRTTSSPLLSGFDQWTMKEYSDVGKINADKTKQIRLSGKLNRVCFHNPMPLRNPSSHANFKGVVQPNIFFVQSCSPTCHSKPFWLSFQCEILSSPALEPHSVLVFKLGSP